MRLRGLTGFLLVLATIALTSSAGSQTDDWPEWRGPARDGVSHETAWSSEGKEVPIWSADVGLGYSNVAIAGGKLVTLGFDEAKGTDHVLCLDRESGAELWRYSFPAEKMDLFHGGGTQTTPTIHGGRVYASERLGTARCLDLATGKLLWERDYAKELGLSRPEYGYASAPLVLADSLYLSLGPRVISASTRDGEIRWKSRELDDGGYATPLPFNLGGRTLLAVFAGPGLVVFHRKTGAEVYFYEWSNPVGNVHACSPIVVDDTVFISAAYTQGALLLRLGEEKTPELVWGTRKFRNKVSGCVLWEGHVYGFDESILKCISFETGEEKWRVRGLGMGAVTVAGGRLIVLSSRGELIVGAASSAGFEEESRRKVLEGGVFWTTPVLLDGRIYARSSAGTLVCLDHRLPEGRAVAKGTIEPDPPIGIVPNVDSLFTAYVEAVGEEALRAKESMRMRGWLENPGGGITRAALTLEWVAPDRWKLVYDLAEFGEVVRCYDGEIGWVLDPFLGNRLIEKDKLAAFAASHDLTAPLDWKTRYVERSTSGWERFDAQDTWAVLAKTAGGTERKLRFDGGTGFLTTREADGEDMRILTAYREFEGVSLPTRIVSISADTAEQETLHFESAAWNVVDESIFARPPEVLKMLRTPEEIAADTERLRKTYGSYLGRYSTDAKPWADVAVYLIVKDGSLALAMGESGTWDLSEPDENERFYFPPTEIYVTFDKDEAGAVTGMLMHGAPGLPAEVRFELVQRKN